MTAFSAFPITNTAFTSFDFAATGAPTNRTMPVRLAEVVNVKDWGAVGDGSTNDTAAIQAAFDAAFGTWASPHGGDDEALNKSVWFPPGAYKVASPLAAKTVSGAADNGSGLIRLTLNNTTSLANGDIVYVRAVGGVSNANLSYTIKDVDSTHVTLVNSTFSGAYTSGGTVRTPCLRVKDVQGGKIVGSGKMATRIFTDDTACAVISTNGWGYGTVSDIGFASAATGIAFDLNGDGGAAIGGDTTVASQSSMFINCSFGGGATPGDYAVTIGMGQHMGSEMTFLNCYVAAGTVGGLCWFNFNALAGTVIGGNIASNNPDNDGAEPVCGSGILVNAGACPIIHGVSFQNFNGQDIDIQNGAGDAYCITGCRTESENFVSGPAVTDMSLFIGGCCQATSSTAEGYFYQGGCSVTIDACASTQGANKYISGQNASVIVRNSLFVNSDYWYGGSNENYNYLEITPQPEIELTAATYTTLSRDGGCKLKFNRATAQTVTIPKNSDATNRLTTGAFIDVQQTGAGKTTFVGASGVTVRSRGGLLSLNGQYAVGRLVCDGADLWTFSGDIAA
jgi:hypothetical protein